MASTAALRPQLTMAEVAELLDIHPRTLRRWMVAGEAPPFYQREHWIRFDAGEVQQWLADRRVDSEGAVA